MTKPEVQSPSQVKSIFLGFEWGLAASASGLLVGHLMNILALNPQGNTDASFFPIPYDIFGVPHYLAFYLFLGICMIPVTLIFRELYRSSGNIEKWQIQTKDISDKLPKMFGINPKIFGWHDISTGVGTLILLPYVHNLSFGG